MLETIEELRIRKIHACICLTDRTQGTRRIEAYMYMSACLCALFVRELFSRLVN